MARNLNPSLLTFIGHLQGKVHGTISSDKKKWVTLGQDDMIIEWNISDMTSRQQIQLNNPNQQTFTCFDYSQQDGVFAMGTQSGSVILMTEYNTLQTKLVYKSMAPITYVKYSNSHRFLAIGSEQDRAAVYDKQNDRFIKCDKGHDGVVTYAQMSNDENWLITMSMDGYANLYRYYEQQLQNTSRLEMVAKYRMCHKDSIKKYMTHSQRPNHTMHLTFGGATTLQQLSMSQNSQLNYRIKVQIHEQTQLINVCWVNQHILGVCTQLKFSLWNYTTKNRFHVVNHMTLYPLLSDGHRILGCDAKGVIYRYENDRLFQLQLQQTHQYLQQLQKLAENNGYPQPIQAEQQQQQQQQQIIRKKVVRKPQISHAAQLVTKGPQTGLQTHYQMHMDLQFMFYNQYGCIVRRIDEEDQMMELQYHDKFKIRRIKFTSRKRLFYYFAITDNILMYASTSQAFFEMESYHRSKNERDQTPTKHPFMSKWQFRCDDDDSINNVVVGNSWAAIVCTSYIRIFDFFGNQLNNICCDRQYLASAAYQDMLVVAYSSTVPLAQAYMFQLKFYKISNQSFKLERKTIMPVKIQQQLKWFGFSQQGGCLFNQDTSETVRMYLWDLDEWVNVYEQDKFKFKLYIQHIQNYQIYGFKIQQKQGEPRGPTVLPRSLPRKIFLQFPQHRLKFFSEQENKRLQSIYMRRLSLIHEKFRSRRWYKYKYSRALNHPLFGLSQKIRSEQQLIQMTTQLDIYTVDQIKKVLPSLQTKLSGQELRQAKMQLSSCCQNLLFYRETISKVHSMLGFKNPFQQYDDHEQVYLGVEGKQYKQLNGLMSMIDLGWIDKEYRVNKMQAMQ